MSKVKLNQDQKELKSIIECNLEIAKNWQNEKRENIDKAFTVMSKAAHDLHMQLEPKPKHHKYMIDNRGMEPEDPDFYNHIHPVEDLLAYLDDTSANDDPEDLTMGHEFDFKVYSRRWRRYDNYTFKRVEKGWNISMLSYNGILEIERKNYDSGDILKSILGHDSISYPVNINSYLYSIWYRAKDEGLLHEEVQDMLNTVAEWISKTEKMAPDDILM